MLETDERHVACDVEGADGEGGHHEPQRDLNQRYPFHAGDGDVEDVPDRQRRRQHQQPRHAADEQDAQEVAPHADRGEADEVQPAQRPVGQAAVEHEGGGVEGLGHGRGHGLDTAFGHVVDLVARGRRGQQGHRRLAVRPKPQERSAVLPVPVAAEPHPPEGESGSLGDLLQRVGVLAAAGRAAGRADVDPQPLADEGAGGEKGGVGAGARARGSLAVKDCLEVAEHGRERRLVGFGLGDQALPGHFPIAPALHVDDGLHRVVKGVEPAPVGVVEGDRRRALRGEDAGLLGGEPRVLAERKQDVPLDRARSLVVQEAGGALERLEPQHALLRLCALPGLQ